MDAQSPATPAAPPPTVSPLLAPSTAPRAHSPTYLNAPEQQPRDALKTLAANSLLEGAVTLAVPVVVKLLSEASTQGARQR